MGILGWKREEKGADFFREERGTESEGEKKKKIEKREKRRSCVFFFVVFFSHLEGDINFSFLMFNLCVTLTLMYFINESIFFSPNL